MSYYNMHTDTHGFSPPFSTLLILSSFLQAFATPSGLPRAQVNLATGAASNPGWTGSSSILAEIGTMQVEFRCVSFIQHMCMILCCVRSMR